MLDYQNDYKDLYENLRSRVREYFELMYYDDAEEMSDEHLILLENAELALCFIVGLIEEEDLDV
jgi:hypothetical protein